MHVFSLVLLVTIVSPLNTTRIRIVILLRKLLVWSLDKLWRTSAESCRNANTNTKVPTRRKTEDSGALNRIVSGVVNESMTMLIPS